MLPVIASLSPDSGVVGDGITNSNTIDLKGTAAAGSTIKVYDGSTQIGSVIATNGSWDYITKVLTDAKHTLTATATEHQSGDAVDEHYEERDDSQWISCEPLSALNEVLHKPPCAANRVSAVCVQHSRERTRQ